MPQAKAREIKEATASDVSARAYRRVERARDLKIRQLPADGQAELDEIIEDMLAREYHKKIVAEAFDISRRSLARYWGAEKDEDEKSAGL